MTPKPPLCHVCLERVPADKLKEHLDEHDAWTAKLPDLTSPANRKLFGKLSRGIRKR